jgi:hypothetical protein
VSSPAYDTRKFLFAANEAKLVLVLIAGMCRQVGVDTSTLRVRSQRTTKEKNVGFRTVLIGRHERKRKKTNTHNRAACNAKKLHSLKSHLFDVPMNGIMLPASTLLDANATPFRLGQKATLWKSLGELLGENYMSTGCWQWQQQAKET